MVTTITIELGCIVSTILCTSLGSLTPVTLCYECMSNSIVSHCGAMLAYPDSVNDGAVVVSEVANSSCDKGHPTLGDSATAI